jgi:hypothetical protein
MSAAWWRPLAPCRVATVGFQLVEQLALVGAPEPSVDRLSDRLFAATAPLSFDQRSTAAVRSGTFVGEIPGRWQ